MKNSILSIIVIFFAATGLHIYSLGSWNNVKRYAKQFFREIHVKLIDENRENEIRRHGYLPSQLQQEDTEKSGLDSKKSSPDTGNVYQWRDKNGILHASNVNYPANDTSLKITKEINQFARETPICRQGNNILIPVTFSNNGRWTTVQMIFDTGAHHTVLYEDYAKHLRTVPQRQSYSTVADGRRVPVTMTSVDSIRVGPHTVKNYTIARMRNEEAEKHDAGLLGMSFLKDHPFTIDYQRNVIVWQ